VTPVLPTYRDLLPEGVDVVRPFPSVANEVEYFFVTRRLDDGRMLAERVEFTWTPFALTKYRRIGLFKWESYRTFDYDKIDRHRQELGVSAIRRLLESEADQGDAK
jgi:hypothetical protein